MKNFWYSLFKTDANKKIFLLLSIAIVLFNFIDAGLSWYFILYLGTAVELNPLMAILMDFGAGWFFLYKGLIVPASVFALYSLREKVAAKICIFLLFFIYTGLMLYFSIILLNLLVLT